MGKNDECEFKYRDSEMYCTDTGTVTETQWWYYTELHEIEEKLGHGKFWFIFRYKKYGKAGNILYCLVEINDKQSYSLDHIHKIWLKY